MHQQGGDNENNTGVPQRVGCITCTSAGMKKWFICSAFLKIIVALVLIAILAEPFVDAVSRFGELTGIPDGIMAAVIPIVSNLNEVIASVLFTVSSENVQPKYKKL
jgi:Ca2+/Na+ antiporter